MMSTKHTPGPWSVERDGNGELAIYAYRTHLTHGDSPLSLETREANARLMAAAPEMLAALREAYLSLECRHHTQVTTTIVKAAIDKAEGKTNG
jgi:hypothetical protein